ncbi:SpoIIE family protein phosphatase [Streptomyces zingiberis]|uniref:SpoIIE family protein phosphatase n=1 Tax=Streptomyces zingiberis TaxID=2053010 RepID=UPI004062B84F
MRSGRGPGPQTPPDGAAPAAGKDGKDGKERPDPPSRADGAGPGVPGLPPPRDSLARDVLDQVPGLVAVVHGPEHRIAYVNRAYTTVFGDRPVGGPAGDALPELSELGLLPVMDQVLRSGRPRTVRAHRTHGPAGAGHYTFTCTPVELSATDGESPTGALPADQPRVLADGASPGATDGGSGAVEGAPPDGRRAPATLGRADGVGGLDGLHRLDGVDGEDGVDGVGRRSGGVGGDGARLPHAPASPAASTRRRGVMLFATDVTDQVEAAERLRTSERRQRETAVTLQRSLLPQKLEQPDDLRVAATYRPGGTDEAVGGDWYDVITLGAGRTALVIGDVMGRGVRAAAVMGQLRTAVRAYARLDLPPHEVLQLLDGLAAEIDPNQIATCLYAVHDPNENRLVHSSAGHLPIIVRDADGTVRRAAEPTGPPLGTGGWVHTSGSLELGAGSTAVLYTDGLVERRDADIDHGIAALEQALASADGPARAVCDRLIHALGVTADHDDDVAVLVLQHPMRTGPDAELFHNAALDLLGGVEAAPRARAFASGVLTSWRFPDDLHDLGVMAASELVANSLQHGTPPMRLRLRRTDRRLIVEVTDGDDHLPRRRRAEPVDESGRGISIIATIASAWGSRRTPGGGKAVWCEFALPDSCRPPG